MVLCRLFLLCLVIGLGQSQLHGGEVSCYNCGGPGPDHSFPGCLSGHVHHCHHEEICQINYGGREVEMRCHRRGDCEHQVNEADRTCSSGDALVHDRCQKCCSDQACVDAVVQTLNTQAVADHTAVHCPGMCHLDNLADCITNGHVCHDQQYCKVSLDEHSKEMHGHCEDINHIQNCQNEAADGRCEHNRCITGCCTNDSCVVSSVGAQTSSLYEILKGDCVDQIPADQCATLDTSEHLCADRLALRLCPQSCGLCSAFHANDCADTVQGPGGCQALVTSENICANSVAKYVCPVTCNMCDALLEEKIKEAIANARPTSSPVATTQITDDVITTTVVMDTTTVAMDTTTVAMVMDTTTTAAPATAAPTDNSNFISCSDLATQDCAVMNVLCPTLNCPEVCATCQ